MQIKLEFCKTKTDSYDMWCNFVVYNWMERPHPNRKRQGGSRALHILSSCLNRDGLLTSFSPCDWSINTHKLFSLAYTFDMFTQVYHRVPFYLVFLFSNSETIVFSGLSRTIPCIKTLGQETTKIINYKIRKLDFEFRFCM